MGLFKKSVVKALKKAQTNAAEQVVKITAIYEKHIAECKRLRKVHKGLATRYVKLMGAYGGEKKFEQDMKKTDDELSSKELEQLKELALLAQDVYLAYEAASDYQAQKIIPTRNALGKAKEALRAAAYKLESYLTTKQAMKEMEKKKVYKEWKRLYREHLKEIGQM